jgi:hypothetical protein
MWIACVCVFGVNQSSQSAEEKRHLKTVIAKPQGTFYDASQKMFFSENVF